MDLYSDQRTVMTLDAGGTNFIFSAIKEGKEIVEPVKLSANAGDKEKSLKAIIKGFREVEKQLGESPVAISFAFPGPADYPAGIINNVGNLPAFAGGVALGPMLEEEFGLPVFINNDGDLFTYGEAMAGLLPEVNNKLKKNGVPKEYKNLFGATIGTGFGGGIVVDKKLSSGDNSASGEIWISRNFESIDLIAEEGVSNRAIQQAYNEFYPQNEEDLTAKDIYDIGHGNRAGNQQAALQSFKKMGCVLGEALANAITLIDGLIVIGGGISAGQDLFLPAVIEHLNGKIGGQGEKEFSRLVSKVYNLEDSTAAKAFYNFESKQIQVPFSDKKVPFVPEKRIAVGISRLGTSEATALGAYAFALNNI